MSPGEDRFSHRTQDLVQFPLGFLLSTFCFPVFSWLCDKPFTNFDIFPSTCKLFKIVFFKELLKILSWAFTGNLQPSFLLENLRAALEAINRINVHCSLSCGGSSSYAKSF